MTRPSRATASGRAYLDLLARARREGRPADEMLIAATASFRQVELRPVSETLLTLGQDRQREWQGLITRAGLDDILPSDYAEAIREVALFGDPVITGSATSGHWDHRRTRWTG